ncbi:MAG TPA: PHP domain-containing protein [Methanoculleus sp.]|nr:PHP domain-containing protein [Methanoculleus sp.]
MLRCDLHVHTSFSKDGESSVEDCLRVAEERGLDAIAICDHDTVEAVVYAETLASPVLVIPGIEVSTHEGHMIALGIREPVPDGLLFEDTVARARRMGALVILPHPYHKWRHGVALKIRDALEMVDAVESFNSRYITGSANRKADRIARELGKPRVAGSDAHNARFIGYGETLVDAEKDIDAILDAIREGRCQIRGRMTPLRTYTRQSMRGAKRRLTRKIQHR